MQQQLIDLQPQLVDTSERTEKLMIKIEQDTVLVEKQKEVCINEALLRHSLKSIELQLKSLNNFYSKTAV